MTMESSAISAFRALRRLSWCTPRVFHPSSSQSSTCRFLKEAHFARRFLMYSLFIFISLFNTFCKISSTLPENASENDTDKLHESIHKELFRRRLLKCE